MEKEKIKNVIIAILVILLLVASLLFLFKPGYDSKVYTQVAQDTVYAIALQQTQSGNVIVMGQNNTVTQMSITEICSNIKNG